MFTGIIEELGLIQAIRSAGSGLRIGIAGEHCVRELRVHDSVAVNGVCLTVVVRTESLVEIDVMDETLRKTTLGSLKAGDRVNLELPMRLNGRLGGHLVLGHVDTVGEIVRIEPRDGSWMFDISYPPEFAKFLIPVGSVAVDGISLTVANLRRSVFGVSIIPHTMANTNLSFSREGSKVNIEFDVLGKYILNIAEQGSALESEGGDALRERRVGD
jgi:riboflavin synthase